LFINKTDVFYYIVMKILVTFTNLYFAGNLNSLHVIVFVAEM